jgi:hypothetical protein
MTSVLRQLQQEWNSLVPAAQAARVPRVRMLGNNLLEPIAYRRARLEWLRSQLHTGTSLGQMPTGDDFFGLTFGLEIECFPPRGVSKQEVARAITNMGVPCHVAMYGHDVPTNWKIVTDASLGRMEGMEVVSPVLRGDAGFEQTRKVCEVLTRLRCTVNRQCGFHVHVGVANEGIDFFKNLVRTYRNSEAAIDAVVAPSRRRSENGFCGPVRITETALDQARTIDDVCRAIGQDVGRANYRSYNRYRKLNLQSFYAQGTVEFRQHQGSVEAEKIIHWTRFCLRMVLAARKEAKAASATIGDLMDALETPAAEKAYFARRAEYFRNGSLDETRRRRA